jgi:hypothetical protein
MPQQRHAGFAANAAVGADDQGCPLCVHDRVLMEVGTSMRGRGMKENCLMAKICYTNMYG